MRLFVGARMSQVISNFDGDRNENWATPRILMSWIKENLGWEPTLDAAATVGNTKAAVFYNKQQDGLRQNWFGHVWVNPPYGRSISDWVEKAAEQIQRRNVKSIMMLLPARVDTKWFHEIVVPNAWMVYLVKGRISFDLKYTGGESSAAPFPSMLVYYRKHRLQETGIRTIQIPKEMRGSGK